MKKLNLGTFPEKWCQPRRQIQWKGTELEGLFMIKHIDIYLSGLLARRQKAWSQDGGNMRVIANRVSR